MTPLTTKILLSSLFFLVSGGSSLPANDFTPFDIAAENMVVDIKKNTLSLKGNVKIKSKIRGTLVQADYLRLVKDKKSGEVNQMNMDGNIVIEDVGRKLKGLHAVYDRSKSYFKLDGRVELHSMLYNIVAETIIYNLATHEGEILSLPKKRMEFSFLHQPSLELKSGPRRITGFADEARVTQNGKKAILQGRIEIFDPLDETHLSSDRVEFFLNEKDEVVQMICSGHFKMQQKGRVSSARQALFQVKEQTISLIGDAYVKEENNIEVRARNIKMYLEVSKGLIQGIKKSPIKINIPIGP